MCVLLGWDIRGWLDQLWDTLTGISPIYLVAAAILQTAQAVLKAIAWYYILRYAYPNGNVRLVSVVACYATASALNGFLPANIGTLVMLLMFVATIVGATFPGILASYLVQKIFFTVIGVFVYLYLFITIPGSFDLEFKRAHAHPWLTAIIIVGGAALVALLVRIAWRYLKKLWIDAKQGGEILLHPSAYFLKVFLPQFAGWIVGLGVIAVFLAAYDIPVTFHTIMNVVGGNSIANVLAFTPGGVGVNQAVNTLTLSSVTSATNATAYSVAQQLFTTAWNQLFALTMLIWAFGWSGGKQLVADSYQGAKEKAAERRNGRRASSAPDDDAAPGA